MRANAALPSVCHGPVPDGRTALPRGLRYVPGIAGPTRGLGPTGHWPQRRFLRRRRDSGRLPARPRTGGLRGLGREDLTEGMAGVHLPAASVGSPPADRLPFSMRSPEEALSRVSPLVTASTPRRHGGPCCRDGRARPCCRLTTQCPVWSDPGWRRLFAGPSHAMPGSAGRCLRGLPWDGRCRRRRARPPASRDSGRRCCLRDSGHWPSRALRTIHRVTWSCAGDSPRTKQRAPIWASASEDVDQSARPKVVEGCHRSNFCSKRSDGSPP